MQTNVYFVKYITEKAGPILDKYSIVGTFLMLVALVFWTHTPDRYLRTTYLAPATNFIWYVQISIWCVALPLRVFLTFVFPVKNEAERRLFVSNLIVQIVFPILAICHIWYMYRFWGVIV